MELTTGWTGRTACALQAALRLSNESFAERLGIGVRTVASWHEKPTLRQKSEMQQILDAALEQAPAPAAARFTKLVSGSPHVDAGPASDDAAIGAKERLDADPNISAALDWLDVHAGWAPGIAWREVVSRLARLDMHEVAHRGSRRGRVDQRSIAQALSEYYRDPIGGHGLYGARYGDGNKLTTSILTRPDWLDLDCLLDASTDQLVITSTTADSDVSLDDKTVGSAVQRLAETLAMEVRFVNMPVYRLLGINPEKGRIAGSVGVAHFAEYALTMDLLEAELIDVLTANATPLHGSLPLRDRYLPDLATVLDLPGRLCAGGTLALCAIARPASAHREADYLLLVQERSGHVLNAARRLAVIPKAFHQPMSDFRADAQIGATLRREMEEELFGREEIDNTLVNQRRADPMHPSLLSEPMRWLMEDSSRLRMECTGFGLNLVSGNYEFPGLVVVEDEEFWARYGGQIAANWESSALHLYSSRDSDLLAGLIGDVAWSNEGLFALLQGLRRLAQLGADRVNLPSIDWEMR